MRKKTDHITRAVVWLSILLPIDCAKNIQGKSEWWTMPRGWAWDPHQSINDLVYFLSWDLSWLGATYFFYHVSTYMVEKKERQDAVFFMFILSVAMRGLAYGKLIDEFSASATSWGIGEITIDLMVASWCFVQIYKRYKIQIKSPLKLWTPRQKQRQQG